MPIEKISERENGAIVLNENEEVELEQASCSLFFDEDNKGEGKMYLSNQRVVWLSDADSTLGYGFDYPTFIIHAISRSPESFKHPCIYCQLQSDADEDEDAEIPEVPKDEAQLEPIFKVFSEMSAMHPDPADSQADDEEGNSMMDLMDPNHQWITADNIGDFEHLKEWTPEGNADAMESADEDEESEETPEN